MTANAIEALFEEFNTVKVLVVGDVMLDSYLWGTTTRISPEAPVPIVNVKNKEKRLGGAANVALNLQAMGATPFLCSLVGNDGEGTEFFDLLKENNLSAEGVVISSERKTTVKHRIIASSQQLLRVDTEDTHDANEKELSELASKFSALLKKVDVVLFQDYNKGVLTEKNIGSFIEKARLENTPTIVDPKKKNFLAYKNVTLFKPNLKELTEGLNIEVKRNDQKGIQEAVILLKQQITMNNALVTLSEEGVYIGDGVKNNFSPAHKRDIADVSGAGDTVVSVAALCLAKQINLTFLAELSNLAGGLVCEHVGVVPINKIRLKEEAIRKLLD